MDLFSEQSSPIKDMLFKEMGEEWSKLIDDKVERLIELILDKIHNEVQKGAIIYPKREQLFRIFRNIRPSEIRCVIIGQDPYHDGNANGIAFSCIKHLSPSVKQIKYAVSKDILSIHKDVDIPMTLSSWVKQGVFLLNSILSVRAGEALSHQNMGWEVITGYMINKISKLDKPIVWMLWGKSANEIHANYAMDNPKHKVLTCNHPAAASHQGTTWSCNHFTAANMFLTANSVEPIQWINRKENETKSSASDITV